MFFCVSVLSVLSSALFFVSLKRDRRHYLFTAVLTSSEHLFGWFVHSALSEEEKTSLRAGLITNFNEPVNQVSSDMGWDVL